MALYYHSVGKVRELGKAWGTTRGQVGDVVTAEIGQWTLQWEGSGVARTR